MTANQIGAAILVGGVGIFLCWLFAGSNPGRVQGDGGFLRGIMLTVTAIFGIVHTVLAFLMPFFVFALFLDHNFSS